MTPKQIKKQFSSKDIELTLWALTLDERILRLVGVGTKWIYLMNGAGEKSKVEQVKDVKPFVSDLK